MFANIIITLPTALKSPLVILCSCLGLPPAINTGDQVADSAGKDFLQELTFSTLIDRMTLAAKQKSSTLAELRERVNKIAVSSSGAEGEVLHELLGRWEEVFPDDGNVQTLPRDGQKNITVGNGYEKPVQRAHRIPFDVLRGFMVDVFVAVGTPPAEAEVAADVLIYADKRGIDSHGIGRLNLIYIQRIRANIMKASAPITVLKETDSTALVDGNLGLGLVIGPHCMRMCIEKTKKCGIAMVVCRNSTHYGAAGYYTNMATEAGMIGITGTNARASISPTHGVTPMLGTNPLTWAMPSDDGFPVSLDCATSITQRGKIEKFAREGAPTPAGQVVDRDGQERTDTEGILNDLVSGRCSLAPLGGCGENLGGYKGYGYALLVELLSSALCDGKTSDDLTGVDPSTGEKCPMPLGHWFIAIDIERFVPLNLFKSRTGSFLRAIRSGDKYPSGPGRIFTPGEKEHDAMVDRAEKNGTLVPAALQHDMIQLREQYHELREKYPKFPFEL